MTTTREIARRYVQCVVFVLFWMAAEFYLRLTPLQSQFLGIPLIAAFQLAIARRPLWRLWAFDAPKFSVRGSVAGIAAVLAAGCVGLLWLGSGRPAAGLGQRWALGAVAVAACIPAAFAISQQRAAAMRRGLLLAIIAAGVRLGWSMAWAQPGHDPLIASEKLGDFFTLWLCEFTMLFIFDEVAFRGLLDPHLGSQDSGWVHDWGSAVFISILWAVWHLRAYNPKTEMFLGLFAEITPFAFAQVVMGTLLTFVARRTRTLVLPCVVHALMNAYVLSLIR